MELLSKLTFLTYFRNRSKVDTYRKQWLVSKGRLQTCVSQINQRMTGCSSDLNLYKKLITSYDVKWILLRVKCTLNNDWLQVLGVLASAMALLRRCRVNAALTIQLFSQLFHFVNVWAFNRIVAPNSQYCSRAWGLRLKARLAQVLSIWWQQINIR